MNIRQNIILGFLVSIFLFVGLSFAFIDGLTPAEQRGKLIYTKGERASGIPIEAQLSGTKFNAKILPCINCHGKKGIGNPEGGVVPSSLLWSILTKPYSLKFENGRKRSTYNEESFKIAIEKGIDPSGNQLDAVMPFYNLEKKDVEDLIAYLKVIENENPYGVTEDKIDIGVIITAKPIDRSKSFAVVKTMKAYLDLINESGGIFNRKINLIELHLETNSPDNEKRINDFFKKHSLFALVGSEVDDLSFENMELIENLNIPIIGAISAHPTFNRYVGNDFYYLLPGLKSQIRELYDFSLKNLQVEAHKITVFHDETFNNKSLGIFFQSLDIHLHNDLIINMNEIVSPIYFERLKDAGISTCMYFGTPERGLEFFSSAKEIGWHPNLLAASDMIDSKWKNLPVENENSMYISYSTWESESEDFAIENYNKMSSYYDLNSEYKTDQYNHLASVILFTEILKMCGKSVDRPSYIKTLQQQNHFVTGFVSPLKYGPNKRIGSEKVFISEWNKANNKFELIED